MMSKITQAEPQSSGEIEQPWCADCGLAMRHSCTEDMAPAGQRRIYECVKCTGTRSIEIAAA